MADLALHWHYSPDNTSLFVKIQSAQFSDGTLITSAHVRNSFARIFAVQSSMGSDLAVIFGSDEVIADKALRNFGVKILSDDEIEIKLKFASSLFIQQLATADCAVIKVSDAFENYAVTESTSVSGSYKVHSKTPEKVVLKKWRNDELDSSFPPELIVLNQPDGTETLKALQSQVDILDLPLSNDAPTRRILLEKG